MYIKNNREFVKHFIILSSIVLCIIYSFLLKINLNVDEKDQIRKYNIERRIEEKKEENITESYNIDAETDELKKQIVEDYLKQAENEYNKKKAKLLVKDYLISKYNEYFKVKFVFKMSDKDWLYFKVHPKADKDFIFSAIYKSSDNIVDSYYVKRYIDKAKFRIESNLKKNNLNGKVNVNYPAQTTKIGEVNHVRDVLNSSRTTVHFIYKVNPTDTVWNYIPEVRKWLRFLYKKKYDWKLTVKDNTKNDFHYIDIYKGDYNYTSEEEWSSEQLGELMWETMEFYRDFEGGMYE